MIIEWVFMSISTLLFLNLLFRAFYKNLTKVEEVTIEDISDHKYSENRLVILNIMIKYKGEEIEGGKRVKFIEKKMESIEVIGNGIKSYFGEKVKFYYVPFFESFGYLDIPQVNGGGILPRAVLFLISLIPNISFFFI